MTIPENWASIDPPISNSPTLTSIINHSSSSKQSSSTSKKHSSQYSEEDDEDSDSNSDSNSENSEDETVSTDSGSECSASSCSTCSDEYDSEESDSSCSSISSDHRKVKEKLKKQQNNISSNSKSRFIVESRSAPKPLTKASVVSDFDHVNNHSSSPVMSQYKSGSISQAETLNTLSQKSTSKLVTVQQTNKKNKSSNANVTRKFFKRKQQQQLQQQQQHQQQIQQLQTLHNNATVRICRFFYGSQLPFSSTKACKII